MMNTSYMLYQAGRVKSVQEQRAEDVRTGRLAAELGRLWYSPRRHRARVQREFRRAVEAASACQAGAGRRGSLEAQDFR